MLARQSSNRQLIAVRTAQWSALCPVGADGVGLHRSSLRFAVDRPEGPVKYSISGGIRNVS